MKYRKLRIAWSVAWCVVAVLLCVLCVRSYQLINARNLQVGDFKCFKSGEHRICFCSEQGRIYVGIRGLDAAGITMHILDSAENPVSQGFLGFISYFTAREKTVRMPHWFIALSITMLASVPWIRWSKRFSLHTLLIATTLVSVVLGLIVYALGR
jgi:hypothetical protein